jgi:hypothetical protein
MFPKVKKAMDKARLEQLGQMMKQRKIAMKKELEGEMMPPERRVQEEVKDPTRTTTR